MVLLRLFYKLVKRAKRLRLEMIRPVPELVEREDIFTPHNEKVKESEKNKSSVCLMISFIKVFILKAMFFVCLNLKNGNC